ncbi:hypothetical protein [Haladaptatus sp. NG-SE-30]
MFHDDDSSLWTKFDELSERDGVSTAEADHDRNAVTIIETET